MKKKATLFYSTFSWGRRTAGSFEDQQYIEDGIHRFGPGSETVRYDRIFIHSMVRCDLESRWMVTRKPSEKKAFCEAEAQTARTPSPGSPVRAGLERGRTPDGGRGQLAREALCIQPLMK